MMCTLNNMSTPLASSLLRLQSSMRRGVLISRRSIQSSISLLATRDHNHQVSAASSSSSSSTSSSRTRDHHLTAASSVAATIIRQQHSKSSMRLPAVVSGASSGFLTYDLKNTKHESGRMLPKQPLPDLNASLNRYLNSLRPILMSSGEESDREKMRHTEACVRRFLDPTISDSNGLVLQDILYGRAVSRDNWALEKNIDQYLTDTKNCLPIHASPAKVMKRQHFANENDYLTYTTLLMKAIHEFKSKIDNNTLETDRCNAYEKGQPMCMEQYKSIFSSYREPGVYRDCFRVHNDDLANQFAVVMSKGQLFKVDLVVDSNLVSDLEIFQQLREIRRVSSLFDNNPRQELGYLTTLPRCEWANVRQSLMTNPINRKSLKMIEKSSFMICLDEKFDSSSPDDECVMNGLQILHGSGVEFNSRNRWYDKTLQFVISEDGLNGLVREHSPSEGPITVNLINSVYKSLKSARFFDSSEIYPFSEPERLEWSLSDDVVEKINEARHRHDRAIKNFDMTVFKYEKFGRNYPKMFNMSPDSFLQVVYQLAYFRMYGKLPVHVSFASQRRFHKGRADYIRPTTWDSLQFCLAMNSTHSTMSEKFYWFEKAVEAQTRVMVETILGNGFDCHLVSLKKIADELNSSEMPDIFKDPSFELNSEYQLVTSQVTTTDDGTFSCFSPTSPVGYGSSYNLKPEQIVFMMSAYKSMKHNSISCLSHSLVESLNQVHELCQHRFKSISSNERRIK